jgi:hypothetical protein
MKIDVEKIKTFKDACKILGDAHPFVQAYRCWENGGVDGQADIEAFFKLRIITAALNEGWEPRFTQGEYRYTPGFCFWQADKLAEKSGEWKKEQSLIGLDDYKGEWAGFTLVGSTHAPVGTSEYLCARLCYRSEALAVYSGRQFADLWADIYLLRK